MIPVYLGLGSNIHRHQHIHAALDALTELFESLKISSVYESKAVGFKGNNFFNLVVGAATPLAIADLAEKLKQIENNNGRVRNGPRFSPRSLDIDILTYGNFVGNDSGVQLPRAEIIENAFVLRPLAEIAPYELHPELQMTYLDLWKNYDQASQSLWPINFSWQGKNISVAKV